MSDISEAGAKANLKVLELSRAASIPRLVRINEQEVHISPEIRFLLGKRMSLSCTFTKEDWRADCWNILMEETITFVTRDPTIVFLKKSLMIMV